MSVEPGKTLLHYRVTEKIGEGGMGVVWKARDLTLDRDVAIKVLPDETGNQTERLMRFEREAKLLASLNHPNIASVYGLHEADGVRFIVMEMVGGEDLAEHIARGPIPPREAVAIASQIAEALSAAHDAGVIHRDLKPANVKLTDDGMVKVLDFGLAKAFAAGSSSDVDLAHSPTVTSAGTMVGVILGTAAYMSPEQARGRPVDRRTDLWALGAVLFEMLSGRQAFPGNVVSEIIARILERDPDWDALPEPLHPSVRRLLARCLAKDPKDRLHDAADARIELQDLLLDPTGASAEQAIAPRAATPLWRRALPWTIAGALLVWIVLSRLLAPAPSGEAVVHFEILPPLNHEFGEFSTSPDGTAVAFVAVHREGARSLWVRRLGSIEMEELPGTDDARFPFWAPDSRSVAFFARGKLRRIDLATRSMQTVADAPNGRGGDWSTDGTILFTPDGADVLYAVPASGGTPVAVTKLRDGEETDRFPHFLAGTRRFTFSAHGPISDPLRRYVGSLDSDEVIPLPDGMSETYWPGDHLLFVREGNLIAQRFDSAAGRLTGEAFPLAQDISDVYPRTARSAFSVSGNGVLMYLRWANVDARFSWYDRYGRPLESIGPDGDYSLPVLSHAGDRIAFARFDRSTRAGSLWVLDVARGTPTRLADGLVGNGTPAWSPDDGSILYSTDRYILRMKANGGPAEVLFDGAAAEQSSSLASLSEANESSSGAFLTFSAWDPVTDFDVWVLPLDGKSPPTRLTDAVRRQDGPRISPSERFVAYQSNESGRFEVYVRSTSPSDERWLVSTDGGRLPLWKADGSELYYVSPEQELMAVSIRETTRGLDAGIPERLFVAPRAVPTDSGDFLSQPTLVGTDGDRFLFHVPAEELPQRAIEVVLNWEGLLEE